MINKILFIITGSIAASRCIEVINLLNTYKIQISCILTEEAKNYIKTSDLRKVLRNRIFTELSQKYI